MIHKLVLAGATLALVTAMIPRASAQSFDLNVDYCTELCMPPGTSGGTVTVTGNGTTTVTISVALNSLVFHQTSGLDAFMFNATGPASISISGLTSGFSICGVTSGTVSPCSTHEDGAGTFQYIACYSAPSCPQTSGGPGTNGGTFTVTLTGVTAINVETRNSNASNVDFAANVTTGVCTGLIGGGNGTAQTAASPTTSGTGTVCSPNTSVPEPTSVLLLGTGLLFAGKFLKAKLLVG